MPKDSKTRHSVFTGLKGCREFFLILAAIGIGQFLIVEFGGQVFRTVPLSWKEWLEIIGCTSLLGHRRRDHPGNLQKKIAAKSRMRCSDARSSLLLIACAGFEAAAQPSDSVDWSAGGKFRERIDRHTSTKAYRMLYVGAPLIVGGVVMQAYDSDFRRLRNGYAQSFHQEYDDWLPVRPPPERCSR